MRIAVDDDGLEYLEIDGKKPTGYLISGGMFGRPSGIGKDVKDLLTPERSLTKKVSNPVPLTHRTPQGAGLGRDRGDGAVPDNGPCMGSRMPDYKLAAAYCRVYNDWILDFLPPQPSERLIPIAPTSRFPMAEEGAQRAGKDGQDRGPGGLP